MDCERGTGQQRPRETWRDPAVPAAERVTDLLARMTVREKVAQLYGLWVNVDAASGEVAPHQDAQQSAAVDWHDIVGTGSGSSPGRTEPCR